MRSAKTMIVIAVAVLTAAACDRGRQADETARQETAAADTRRQQDETMRLEQRVDQLERRWNDVQQRLSAQTAEAGQDIKESFSELRREVADLRTTNAENWWDRTERELEEAANEVEQDVRRFARRWSPGEPEDEVGTAGEATGWEARRDRLVSRLEARIEAMEEALRDTGRGDRREVEQTRARVRELREDANRLRNASEDDWWEITRDRLSESVDRLEDAIDRLVNDDTNAARSGRD